MSAPHLQTIFRNLSAGKYEVTSPQDKNYNCIAWAANETHRRWWPIGGYWPPNVPPEETVESFVLAFKTLGYETCSNVKFEKNFQKVAIYVDSGGSPTHMARQLESGEWTSKLGSLEDIKHNTLRDLEGDRDEYGHAVRYLSRPVTSSLDSTTMSWLQRLIRQMKSI